MKIPNDLRCAIRAISNKQRTEDHASIRAKQKAAIATLIALPKYKARVNAALKKLKRLEEQRMATASVIRSLGIDCRLDFIYDSEKFAKAGGRIEASVKFSFEGVIADLAAATTSEGRRILKRIGINWE